MLDDIWKRGIDISEVSNQAGTQLPTIEVSTTDTVAKLVDKMLQSSVTSVLIAENHTPIGVINERELLKEIVEEHKDPKKTLAKDLNYTPLIILQADESMITAMRLMEEKGMKRAAMIKNGQLIGMLMENAANVTKRVVSQVKASVS
jgi:predicted transcriptional regulator